MFRTALLLGLLTGIFLLIGNWLGGQQGALIAFGLAAVMNFGSYWFSDKLVLAMYRAEPLDASANPELYSMVQQLCMRYSLPLPRIYLIPEASPNAFATGRNEQHAVLGITSGLLNIMNADELRGVLAHELAHIKNRDMLTSTIAATIAGAISQLAHLAVIFAPRGENEERGTGPLEFIIFLILTPLLAMLIQMAVSREREYKADESGAALLGNGISLANALRKLGGAVAHRPMEGSPTQEATAHLFIVNPFSPSFIAKLFSTHPPLEDRVARLERFSPHIR